MGAAAQVAPVALLVQGYLLPLGEILDDLHLVVLTDAAKQFDGLVPLHDDALYRNILGHQFLHARLDLFEVFRGEAVLGGEIIVETVLDHRPYGDLDAGEQVLGGHGQQVGRGMTDDFQARLVAVGDNRQGGVAIDDIRGVHLLAIHDTGEGRLGQAGADIGGDIVY